MTKENKLFDEWIERINDPSKFAPDGLLYNIVTFDKESGIYKRMPGTEEIEWKNSAVKLMFLTKDLPDKEGVFDIREASCLNCNKEPGGKFNKSLMLWTYGIHRTILDGKAPSFKTAQDECVGFFLKTPIVRINVKKQLGEGKISPKVLKEHIENDKDLITRQIGLYDANVIYSGGIGMKDNEFKFIIPDYERFKFIYTNDENKLVEWIYYSEHLNKIIINGWHPSHYENDETIYYLIMNHLECFVKKYPAFQAKLLTIKNDNKI